MLNFTASFQFAQLRQWAAALGINYHVGVDGLNSGLILMGSLRGVRPRACCFLGNQTPDRRFSAALVVGPTASWGGRVASLNLFPFLLPFHEVPLLSCRRQS